MCLPVHSDAQLRQRVASEAVPPLAEFAAATR
jgi:hypothetical protein